MATALEVAEHLDITDRSVRDLQKRGVLPQAKRGALDLEACRLAYIRHLREQAAGRAGAKDSKHSLATERARLAAEQADAVAMKNAAARGEMVAISAVTRVVVTMIEIAKARLAKVPRIVAKNDPAMQDRVTKAIEGALEGLSETQVEVLVSEGDDGEEDADPDDA